MKLRAWGEEYRSTSVCIDSYENGVLSGRLNNPYHPKGRSFDSLSQFLLEREQNLDQMEFPKAFQAARRFTDLQGNSTGPPVEECRAGNLATFTIRILFRQNASWQGSIVWQEGRQEESFRSVLQLILLMNSALWIEKAS